MSEQDPIRRAVLQLARLPGVGEKTATRLVYWLLRAPKGTIAGLAEALVRLSEQVRECGECHDFCADERCALCKRGGRDPAVICVVEQPQDIRAFERIGDYRGKYHVLHGAISPLDGMGPDQLRIRELLERLRGGVVTEVILGTDPTIEGDATAMYLARLLEPLGVRTTRLAHGISVGTEIEYADAVSLGRALKNRQEMTW